MSHGLNFSFFFPFFPQMFLKIGCNLEINVVENHCPRYFCWFETHGNKGRISVLTHYTVLYLPHTHQLKSTQKKWSKLSLLVLSNLSNGLLLPCAVPFNRLHDWWFLWRLHFRELLSQPVSKKELSYGRVVISKCFLKIEYSFNFFSFNKIIFAKNIQFPTQLLILQSEKIGWRPPFYYLIKYFLHNFKGLVSRIKHKKIQELRVSKKTQTKGWKEPVNTGCSSQKLGNDFHFNIPFLYWKLQWSIHCSSNCKPLSS